MPNYENNNVMGTLFVTFDVEFPKGELAPEEKESEYQYACVFQTRQVILSRLSVFCCAEETFPLPISAKPVFNADSGSFKKHTVFEIANSVHRCFVAGVETGCREKLLFLSQISILTFFSLQQ